MAVGILLASGEVQCQSDTVTQSYYYGELGLDGAVRRVRGTLLVAMCAKERGVQEIFVPIECALEGAVVEGVTVLPLRTLGELVEHIKNIKKIEPVKNLPIDELLEDASPTVDFAEIAGQEVAKRAAELSAAGGHNLLLVGPPGAGKTMLAKALPSILPPLSPEESLEVTRIYSVAGMLDPGQALMRRRPYRAPHHTASMISIIGGGSNPMPGEISLAHLGVLFLDELPEFPRATLEVLRQPMEDGKVTISRAAGRAEYPAKFMLLASANPCPCGYLNHPTKECNCGERVIAKYRARISGPILDRIDLHVWVDPVEVGKLTSGEANKLGVETSSVIRERVRKARGIQERRFAREKGIYSNAQMSNKLVKKYCELDKETAQFLQAAVTKYSLSARAYFKVLKVARTIADLAQTENIGVEQVAEAVQYRESVW